MTWLPPISKRILINALYISYGICWMVNSTSFDSGRVLVSYSLPFFTVSIFRGKALWWRSAHYDKDGRP